MPFTTTTIKPAFKPEINFEVETNHGHERQTIVHCNIFGLTAIRIWPTTFLIQDDGVRKQLLHAYNIAEYPDWKLIFGEHTFTLVFQALDADCRIFDLLEDISQPGAFHARNIRRNKEDVYFVEF